MKRGRKIVLLAHCILNPNAKTGGIAQTPGAIPDVVEGLLRDGVGMIQLPCPEQTFAGCRRWGMTREQYDTPRFRRHCRDILLEAVEQAEDYLNNGYEIVGIVGVDGSPSCGVGMTCAGYEGGEIALLKTLKELPACTMTEGPGVFMECFSSMLRERNLSIPMTGIDEERQEALSWADIQHKLREAR